MVRISRTRWVSNHLSYELNIKPAGTVIIDFIVYSNYLQEPLILAYYAYRFALLRPQHLHIPIAVHARGRGGPAVKLVPALYTLINNNYIGKRDIVSVDMVCRFVDNENILNPCIPSPIRSFTLIRSAHALFCHYFSFISFFGII